MIQPRPTVPPPSKGKPLLIVLLLLGIAGAAGVVTWLVVGSGGPAEVPPPPPPPQKRPVADLLVEPPPEPLLVRDDAGPDADGEVDADRDRAKRPTGTRRPKTGTIDGRRVSAFIRSRQGAVRQCYERRLKVNNALQGVLDAQITIQPSGRVSNVNFVQDTLYDQQVKSCVASVIRSWTFPEPEGGQVTVSNLFRFSPVIARQ